MIRKEVMIAYNNVILIDILILITLITEYAYYYIYILRLKRGSVIGVRVKFSYNNKRVRFLLSN